MAISATEIFRRYPWCFDPAMARRLEGDEDPFQLPGLHYTREAAASMAINRVIGGAVTSAAINYWAAQ